MASFHRDSILRCDVESCKYKTYFQEMFDKHMAIHSSYKTCTFVGCSEMFFNSEKLDAHMNKVHLGERAHKCTVAGCEESFYNVKMLHKHMIEVHGEYLYRCEVCSFQSNSQRVYQIHLRCHSSERPFSCTDCNNRFRTRSLLESHRKHRHTIEKPFSCSHDDCGKSFKTNHQLAQHIKRTHTSGNGPRTTNRKKKKNRLQEP